jgi:hypothetical protein
MIGPAVLALEEYHLCYQFAEIAHSPRVAGICGLPKLALGAGAHSSEGAKLLTRTGDIVGSRTLDIHNLYI